MVGQRETQPDKSGRFRIYRCIPCKAACGRPHPRWRNCGALNHHCQSHAGCEGCPNTQRRSVGHISRRRRACIFVVSGHDAFLCFRCSNWTPLYGATLMRYQGVPADGLGQMLDRCWTDDCLPAAPCRPTPPMDRKFRLSGYAAAARMIVHFR